MSDPYDDAGDFKRRVTLFVWDDTQKKYVPLYSTNNALNANVTNSSLDAQIIAFNAPPLSETLINADETAAQSITLDTKGYKIVSIYCEATAATDFTIELSPDNTNWWTYHTASSVTSYNDTITTAFRYVKVSSAAAGAAGDTVTLMISAKP